MKIACRMGNDFKPTYFNAETGNTLYWIAIRDTYAYDPPCNHMQYRRIDSLVKAGERIPYDNMKYGYTERDFILSEV